MTAVVIAPECVRLESPVARVELYTVDIGNRPELTEARLAVLDGVERSRAMAFRFPALTQRYVATWSAVRTLLASRLDAAPERLPILRRCTTCGSSTHGKPFLDVSRLGRSIHFNVTHSELRALVAIADGPVGVDLEEGNRAHAATVDAVSTIALTVGERGVVAALADDPVAQRRAALRAWVRKEAVVKALGVGLPLGLDTLPVTDVDRVRIDDRVVRIADVQVSAGVAAIAWL